MKAKDKAKELVEKYWYYVGGIFASKQCALIAVDEILNIDFIIPEHGSTNLTYNYWESVKQEIEKL